MVAISYRPGPWLGLVRGSTMVLIDGDTSAEVVEDLWDVLAAAPTLQSVLGAVVSAYGTDLAALPEFAIISFDGKMHTILRGDVVVNADGDCGASELSGKGVTTWTERLLPEQELFDVVINDGKEGQCRWLPLLEGVVQLGGIRVGNDGETASQPGLPAEAGVGLDPEPEPGSAALPEPEERPEQSGQWEPERQERPDPEQPVRPEPSLHPEQPELRPESVPQSDPVPSPEPTMAPDADSFPVSAAPNAVEETGIYDDADGLDAPATADTILTPGDAEPNEDERDLEETVIHTQARRANLPAGTVPDAPGEGRPPAGPAVVGHTPVPAPPQAAHPAQASVSLIDSVPWLTPSASARARAADSEAAEAAGRAPAPGGLEGDHDGQTLVRSDLKEQAGPGLPAGEPAGAEPPPSTGPLVLARTCPQGHANPPTRSSCARCSAPLARDAREVKRPSLGRMRLSTGEVIELDRPVIVGRQPSASRVQGSVMPQLVQVRSVSGDISRSHLEVRFEGWHVILGDLKATNGTMLIREGQPPRRLGQGESMILFDGDIADLGDGISLRFEDLL